MAVVRLSNNEERKNVSVAMISNNFCLLVVVIFCVMMSKPLCESINSTSVIAPGKKKSMEAISRGDAVNLLYHDRQRGSTTIIEMLDMMIDEE